MSDLEKFKEILDNQAERGIRTGDWPACAYEESVGEGELKRVSLPKIGIAFAFSQNGRFIGAYNWKQ